MDERRRGARRLALGAIIAVFALSLAAGPAEAFEPEGSESYLALAAYVREIERASPAMAKDDRPLRDVAPLQFQFAQNQTSKDQTAKDAARPAARAKPAATAPAPVAGIATYVGSQECAVCHAKQTTEYSHTLHGRIFLKNPRTPQEKFGCESCHGPGSEHVRLDGGLGVGGIGSFRENSGRPVEERNAVCLSCHERGLRTYWRASTHETRGLACTNCHQIMRKNSLQNQFVKPTEQETCFQCHRQIRAQTYRSSHMPIREGKITCANCHNPHGTPNQSLLKEATSNDVCYGCHAEKRGPFLWEHPPVRENCMNCHDPHGSMNDFLLKVSMPRLCQQCHSVIGHPATPHNPNLQFAFNRACANCHSAVHGSNAPGGVRFHR